MGKHIATLSSQVLPYIGFGSSILHRHFFSSERMNKRVMKRCLRIPSTTYSHPAGMHMHFLCVYTYRKLSSLFSFRAKVTEKSVWDEREKKTRNEGHNLGLAKIVSTYGSIPYDIWQARNSLLSSSLITAGQLVITTSAKLLFSLWKS